MAIYETTITIAHRPQNLFDLVSDIRRYPDFIRWIKTMRVSGERTGASVDRCVGEAIVGFKGFQERFATNVAANAKAMTIETDLVRGPFKRLANTWRFVERPDGQTDVRFFIDYEFKNLVLQALLRANFGLAVDRLVAAFVAEADRRYARVTPPALVSD